MREPKGHYDSMSAANFLHDHIMQSNIVDLIGERVLGLGWGGGGEVIVPQR